MLHRRRRRARGRARPGEAAARPRPWPAGGRPTAATSSLAGTRSRLPPTATSAAPPSGSAMHLADDAQGLHPHALAHGHGQRRQLDLLDRGSAGVRERLVLRGLDAPPPRARRAFGLRSDATGARLPRASPRRGSRSAALRDASSPRRFSSRAKASSSVRFFGARSPSRPCVCAASSDSTSTRSASVRRRCAVEVGLLPLELREERLGLRLLVVAARARVLHDRRRAGPAARPSPGRGCGRARPGTADRSARRCAGRSRTRRTPRPASTARRPS